MSRRNSNEYKRDAHLPQWSNSPPSPLLTSSRLPRLLRRRSLPCKIALALAVLLSLVALPLLVWEPHIETTFYSRKWVKQEVEDVQPLAGCFDADRVSPAYNGSGNHRQVHAGLQMRLGMDCYNFAGTIKPVEQDHNTTHVPPEERVQFHSYWRVDLQQFGERQEWMLKSFFATQNVRTSRFVLWSNGDLTGNPMVQKWLKMYPDAFTTKVVDYQVLAEGTELGRSELLRVKDTKAWIDGDLVRLLVLWAYGGVWVDMDSLLTRDLTPLLDQEFVTQWDCYDKLYVPFNGALMRFNRHSPYLCEAFHIMTTSAPPRPGTTDWGATLYLKLWRRLVASSITPFSILPWCFTDGRSCRLDNRLPDPFVADPSNGQWTMGSGREEGGGLDKVLGKVFSVHLHNQWHKPYPAGGWVERLLLKRYDSRLGRT
ncbi:glycosyltransferase family 32 protein [Cristinia sonorae]|uniref:Glycosyltransferase family 32 protein n=1 Tax=Cristinia sonorae TaxID=1940300 RepID=A0A8K0XLA6_9AGAR|nr:glycosyltransferase family 32 protein [Cristinia sonorae]